MAFEWPEIQKFMPLWVCFTLVLGAVAAFIALLIVLTAASRKREDESR